MAPQRAASPGQAPKCWRLPPRKREARAPAGTLSQARAVEAVLDKVEERLEAAIEEIMSKMSGMVESLSANQKYIQASATALSEMAEMYEKLTLDMNNHVKAAMETSNQLTNMVSSPEAPLLSSRTQALS
ncbi:hypothetical protein EI94DRAFT_1800875 [Lactarius quietus]|nr:hypothetical protein EI94DRAFT_1800875 [Lactarius quietus]